MSAVGQRLPFRLRWQHVRCTGDSSRPIASSNSSASGQFRTKVQQIHLRLNSNRVGLRLTHFYGELVYALCFSGCVAFAFDRTVRIAGPRSRLVAFVIGNSAYRNVAPLPNTQNDATDIAASFQRLGFSVTTLHNGTFDDMGRALLQFGRDARGADMAVVFFAGHGMELGGENWLIPVEAELRADRDAENEAISLKSVMLQVANATSLGLVILTAGTIRSRRRCSGCRARAPWIAVWCANRRRLEVEDLVQKGEEVAGEIVQSRSAAGSLSWRVRVLIADSRPLLPTYRTLSISFRRLYYPR
jgi:hypothetical protein